MKQRAEVTRWLAVVLIAILPAAWFPASAEPTASVTGVIRGADEAPLAGARLLATTSTEGPVFRSEPTTQEGTFTLSGLAPGSYRLGVEVAGGIYLIESPLPLAGGVRRTVQIAVAATTDAPGAAGATGVANEPAASAWDNPFAAAAIVLGLAIVVGVLVNNATDDEQAGSDFLNP